MVHDWTIFDVNRSHEMPDEYSHVSSLDEEEKIYQDLCSLKPCDPQVSKAM